MEAELSINFALLISLACKCLVSSGTDKHFKPPEAENDKIQSYFDRKCDQIQPNYSQSAVQLHFV